MKQRVVDNEIKIAILVSFVGLPLGGWFISNTVGALLGLIFAILIDLVSPKWVFDLTWSDINLALKNLYLYGCNGSLLCFRIGLRKCYIYRDEKGDGVRMGLRIPLCHWKEVFDRDALERITDKFEGWSTFDVWKKMECFVYFPKDGLDGCIGVLRYFIGESPGGNGQRVYGRVDCAKKNIWRYRGGVDK